MTAGDRTTEAGVPDEGNANRPKKRSFSIKGHRTSLSLEEPFWAALREIAEERNLSLAALVAEIDETRSQAGLSTGVRLFVLDHFRNRAQVRSHQPDSE